MTDPSCDSGCNGDDKQKKESGRNPQWQVRESQDYLT